MTDTGRRWTGVDVATAHLVRLVLDQDWSPPTAAIRLRESVGHDLGVLRRLRTRVRRAAVEGRSEVAERALATVEAALVQEGDMNVPPLAARQEPAQAVGGWRIGRSWRE